MPSRRPTIYLIAGCNGAGKTTFAKEFLPSIGVIRFLNADEMPAAYHRCDQKLSHLKLANYS
jgi:predicted ABC-type ATPase